MLNEPRLILHWEPRILLGLLLHFLTAKYAKGRLGLLAWVDDRPEAYLTLHIHHSSAAPHQPKKNSVYSVNSVKRRRHLLRFFLECKRPNVYQASAYFALYALVNASMAVCRLSALARSVVCLHFIESTMIS